MNRIHTLFQQKADHILSVYFTAGHPKPGSAVHIIRSLAAAGADMIEIGMPFSDPMADGPVIQKSSDKALRQGMNLALLFGELQHIRKEVSIPLLLMGYLNPVMQYGFERFCADCSAVGIDGLILPDLPPEMYLGDAGPVAGPAFQGTLKSLFDTNNLSNVFLITPQTPEQRIRHIDSISNGFIYMVSSSSTTGMRKGGGQEQTAYYERIAAMNLQNPRMIGFGISDHAGFEKACQYAQGTIVGSAFVRMVDEKGDDEEVIRRFIETLRNG